MNFTEDWFTHNIPNFEICMSAIPDKKFFLEIGSFEGRSTCWLLENGLSDKGNIVCVDPFIGTDMPAVEAKFWSNVREVQKSPKVVSLMRTTSYKALAEMILYKMENNFDFIYVDGSHAPDMALTDACMAWGLLKKSGVMLFDDYQYPHEPTKEGIDAFLAGFKGQYEIIINNYQLGVKKI